MSEVVDYHLITGRSAAVALLSGPGLEKRLRWHLDEGEWRRRIGEEQVAGLGVTDRPCGLWASRQSHFCHFCPWHREANVWQLRA